MRSCLNPLIFCCLASLACGVTTLHAAGATNSASTQNTSADRNDTTASASTNTDTSSAKDTTGKTQTSATRPKADKITVLSSVAGLPRPENLAALTTLLPNPAQTEKSLSVHPYMQMAWQDQEIERANGQISAKGTHPWVIRAGLVERRNPQDNISSLEPNIGVDKTLRWAGKARLEKQLGGLQAESGELMVGDAWHEAARQLHGRWFDYIRAINEVSLMQQYLALIQKQIEVTQKRIDAGELPRLDRMVLQTEFFNEQAKLVNLQSIAYDRGLALKQIYSGQLPVQPDLSGALPVLLQLSRDVTPFLRHPAWAMDSIADNHELELAKNAAEQARKRYEIVRQQKVGDPTLGGGYFSELNNREKLYAVNISIPLGMPAYPAHIAAARSEYDKSRVHYETVKSNLTLEIRQDISQLVNASTQLQYASQQLKQFEVQNKTLNKAYKLGEVDMSTLILNQKQNRDVMQRLTSAEIDFLAGLTLLYINTHQLWPHREETASPVRQTLALQTD